MGRQVAFLFCIVLLSSPAPAKSRTPQPSQEMAARVDDRVELLSIVFREAGSFEYNLDKLPRYSKDIDRYFAPYRNHPAVRMARELALRKGVGFDSVMAMAISLSHPPELKPLVPFTATVPEQRWGADEAEAFLPLLRDFYRSSQFQRFYETHQAMYRLAEARFAGTQRRLNVSWFPEFFGPSPHLSYRILLGMNNGSGSYAVRLALPDGGMDLYSIVGCWTNDDAGNPTYPPGQDYLATVVHEFNHSFVNPVINAHWTEFAAAGEVYSGVATEMRGLAYGNAETMVDESVVRAAAIVYFRQNGEEARRSLKRIREEQRRGFFWMDGLVDCLERYQEERAQYPAFSSYVPQLAAFYSGLAPHAATETAEFDAKSAHVVSMEPVANRAQDVDPKLRMITIVLDKPLDPEAGYSINAAAEENGLYPIAGKPRFEDGGQRIILPLRLRPHQSYGFVLTPLAFATRDGYPLASYKVQFRTGP